MAAGPWYTSSGLGDANIAIAARTIQTKLNEASKSNALVAHPVMQQMLAADEGLGQLMGELGVSFGLLTHGTGVAAATAEGTPRAATNYSLSNSTTITPARHVFAREVSDFGASVQGGMLRGELAPDQYAMVILEGFEIWRNTLVDKVTALFSSLSNEIGTTATDLTWSAVNNGIIDFKNRGNTGPALGMLDAVGAKDLMGDIAGLGGAVQWAPQAQQSIQDAQAGSYLGRFFNVDFFLSSSLDDDATDRFGAIIAPGCIQSKHQRVPLPAEADLIADAGWYTVEALRQDGSVTKFNTVTHLAVQLREDARGSMLRYGVS